MIMQCLALRLLFHPTPEQWPCADSQPSHSLTSMSVPLPLQRISEFLSRGSEPIEPTHLQLHLLRGWRDSTLLSYNAAVRKFLKFLLENGRMPWVLPASPSDIYDFCFWAGRVEANSQPHDIAATSLKKYLYGIQAWHTYHDLPYPRVTEARVKILLRACERQDALTPARPLKQAVHLKHLLILYHAWVDGPEEDVAALDCVLVAFWGMMRLAEVTYDQGTGKPAWINSVLCQDVIQPTAPSSSVTIAVRGAKTAKAGTAQMVLLNTQPNLLCPVLAVKRRLSKMSSPTDSLFGYGTEPRHNLTRSRLVMKCSRVWIAHGHVGLSGHSFRVGGASLRAAVGVSHEHIKRLGRWTSDCYKLYLREYSGEELSQTVALLNYLNR